MSPLTARLAAAAILAAVSMGCRDDYKYYGIPVNPSVQAPPVVLTRGDGAVFDMADQGKAALVFFGYTNCPDVCPTTLSDWKRVKAALKEDAARVSFVFITIDPRRDTPAVTAQYTAKFDSSFVGLSGDTATLEEIAKAFGVTAFIDGTSHSEHYAVAHPSRVYLVDPAGRIRFVYPPGLKPEELAEDIRHVL